MLLLIDEFSKRAVQALTTDSDANIPQQVLGDVIEVGVARISPLANSPARLWNPLDIDGWLIRVGMGNAFQLPLAGVMVFTFEDEDTSELAYNLSASGLQIALNGLSTVSGVGGVTVRGDPDFYIIDFLTPGGPRELFEVDVTNLAPLSTASVSRLVEGGGLVPETQIVRINQQSAAIDTLLTLSDGPGVVVDIVQVGGGGFNQKVRFALTPGPYDGVWTLSIGGQETDVISWNEDGSDLLPIVEALSTVGTGNVTVVKEDETHYLLAFKGTKANTDMGACVADGSALRVVRSYSGTLDLGSGSLQLLMGNDSDIDTTFEVKGTPPGGLSRTLFRQLVNLVAPIIQPDQGDFRRPEPSRIMVITLAGGEESVDFEFDPPLAAAPSIIDTELSVVDGGSVYTVTVLQSSIQNTGATLIFGGPANAGDQIMITAYV